VRIEISSDLSQASTPSFELRDLVSDHSEWLSHEVPGFAEALAWPDVRGSSGAPHLPILAAHTIH